MANIVVKVKNLGKKYQIGAIRHGSRYKYRTIREVLMQSLKAPIKRASRLLKGEIYGASEMDETLWALRGVSFEIQKGEVIGIIGRNGAGKSTLLKILSRITEPSEGIAEIYGRVGSLLEVGTGFHPELTGRENVYLNAAILGMRKKEIEQKMDNIIEFAEIEKFINTPVKFYSSGMYVRLAFSVAAHLEPEILLVDEVLAVGDIGFQKKCLGRMGKVAESGRTVLFVSHNLKAVRKLCSKAVVIDEGEVRCIKPVKEAIDYYLDNILGQGEVSGSTSCAERSFPRDDSKTIQLTKISVRPKDGKTGDVLRRQDPFVVEMACEIREVSKFYWSTLKVFNETGDLVLRTDDDDLSEHSIVSDLGKGEHKYRIEVPGNLFIPGIYFVSIILKKRNGVQVDRQDRVISFEIHDNDSIQGLRARGYSGKTSLSPDIRWEQDIEG